MQYGSDKCSQLLIIFKYMLASRLLFQVNAMLKQVDSIIRYLMNSLLQRRLDHCVNLIVLADHGVYNVFKEMEAYSYVLCNGGQVLSYL